ncbi:hypothetical protein [Streptomyces cinereospinus]|uniref:DUF222 domain-containing protein n=1 Tax=Streptomyces cinereospinus TaxID=285561 RepID=A0ABV5MV90_9ACTN
MGTKALADAYRDLVAAAESITGSSPLADADRAQADWLLAHIALSDRALIDAARQVLVGHSAWIDNARAMSKSEIAKVLSATRHTERVDMVRRTARELLAVLDCTSDTAAEVTVRARLAGRNGAVVLDSDLPWGEVIRLRATEHIPGHAASLAAWASPTSAA